jgi:DNA-binding CsgD family transcriptional regulator
MVHFAWLATLKRPTSPAVSQQSGIVTLPRGAYALRVAASRVRDRARERIEAISATSTNATALRRDALDALAPVIEFDAHVWLLTDPVTAVGAAPLADVPCLPELPTLIKAKYATLVNRWTALQRGPSPVGLLHEAVDGDLARSHVWQEVLRRYEIGDVFSAVFADQFGCWGFLDLWRNDTRTPFGRADAALIAAVAPSLTAGLRRCQAETFVEPAAPQRPGYAPVVLTLNDDLRITSRTAATQSWLDMLLPPRPDERGIPASVYNVAAQLLAVEAGIDDHPAWARVHLADGFWLTLRAARLASEESAPAAIVVTIEEASAAERLELLGQAFGLTARESELLAKLAMGSDTRAMARQMALSEHTVQDHLKAIFTKTGARDRITVLSRALGTRNVEPGSADGG